VNQRIAPYGHWESPLDLRKMFERPSAPQHPALHNGDYYWIEARADEGGRLVLMQQHGKAAPECLTPPGFNVRSRVHEYGGRCHCFCGEFVYFSNFSDQRLYRQRLVAGEAPVPLTPIGNADGSLGMYADPCVTPDGAYLLVVYEQEFPDRENRNGIAAIELGYDGPPLEPVVLVAGNDFYAGPVVSLDGRRLAWMQWDHPAMPWDRSEIAVLDDFITVLAAPETSRPRIVAGGDRCSVGGLCFAPDGVLYFYMDRDDRPNDPAANYWNLHAWNGSAVRRVTADSAEYGLPHWVFGETRILPVNERHIVACRSRPQGEELVVVEPASGNSRVVATGFTGFAQLAAGPDAEHVLCTAQSGTVTPKLVEIDINDGSYRVLQDTENLLSLADISVGEPIMYPTTDGHSAHAYFYAPRNQGWCAPARSLPPLLVMVHGGPTSRCDTGLAFHRQYWTTLGFAVLDVNHRGSTGYGRTYRQALRGRWGDLDCHDIIDGVRYLVENGKVKSEQVFIRGGSAGGYAVLRALTEYPHLFAGGACYYGIGNLVTLARSTHKFEARYLDGLLGEAYDPGRAERPDSVYYRRSPIHFLDRLRSPMIVFQGLEDKVVPPELSRELVHRLKEMGIYYEYIEYEGEGHGFRRAETRIDALRRESEFFVGLIDRQGY